MAKSCPHPDHSEPNEKEKRKKNENEEKETVEESECITHKAFHKVQHLKHSWFEKGQDVVVVHIYMKQQSSEIIDVDFQENSVEVKFKTSAPDILKFYPGCDMNTVFEWHLYLRGPINTILSSHKILKAMLELQLQKKTSGRWGSLEMPSFLLKNNAKAMTHEMPTASMQSVHQNEVKTGGDTQVENGGPESAKKDSEEENIDTTTNGMEESQTANGEDLSEASPQKTNVEDFSGNTSSMFKLPNAPPPPPTPVSLSTGVMGGSKSPYNGVRLIGDGQSSDGVASVASGHERDGSKGTIGSINSGYTGLENLGNTCYLNSIVQCLVNTRKLRDYFLDGRYKEEINTENPLGTGGKLAMSFGSLTRNIWSGKDKHLAPQKLKMIVGEKVCQFKGFMQHDAQEFMAFLLDGLHEDLNRVKDKPYTEEVEGAGRPDAEVAIEAWKRHKSRNDSVIVDLFQGQLKSKLTCPVCHKISITFDPFMNLSVPLPKEQKQLPVIVFFRDPSRKPLSIMVKVAQDGALEQLCAAVERKTGISVNNMRVFEAFRGKFYKFFDRGCSLSTTVATDLIIVAELLSQEEAGEEVYEVRTVQRLIYPHSIPSHCGACYRSPGQEEALKRCTHCFSIGYCNQSCQKKHWPTHKKLCKRSSSFVGVPFVISLPASKATFKALTEMAAAYASYSVNVCCGEAELENQSSCKTQGEATRNETVVTSTRNHHSASSQSPSSSSEAEAPEVHPQFYFKPVTPTGESLTGPDGARLQDHGDSPLDLSDKYLSVDWRNHPRMKDFVVVSDKKLDCTVDNSCQSEILTDSYSCTLQECLELFTEPETLSDTDAWYCPTCKKHREATKQMSVWRLPDVLVIHLKRFSFRNILFRDKITKLVDFPLRGLDMSPYSLGNDSKESSLYDLFAVTNHSGTVNFGHYTSYGRLPPDNNNGSVMDDGIGWRYFDDKNVSSTSEMRVVSKYAYVLFYQRRAGAPSSSPVTEVKATCNTTPSPSPLTELKATCNATPSSSPVTELKATCNATPSPSPVTELKATCNANSSSSPVIDVKSKCNATAQSPVTELKKQCNATSPCPVTEVEAKSNATNQEKEEAEAIKPNDKMDRNSTRVEGGSKVKEESERISTSVVGNDGTSDTKTVAVETRFCGNEPAEQEQEHCLYNSVKASLADIDENDLD